MANNYKNNQTSIESSITKLQQDINDYTLKINEITNLTNEIRTSESWQDADLKPDFLNTCTSYIETYQKVIGSLSKNVQFIEKHNNKVAALNQAYSRR